MNVTYELRVMTEPAGMGTRKLQASTDAVTQNDCKMMILNVVS